MNILSYTGSAGFSVEMRHTARVRRALQSTLHPADRRAHPQVRIVLDLVLEIQIRDPQSLYAPGRNRSYKQIKYT